MPGMAQGAPVRVGGMAGVVLAGGQGRRLFPDSASGGDKALAPLAGRSLLAHAVERLRPQVFALAVSANGDPARFADYGLPILPDTIPAAAGRSPGPLAGILAGMEWARQAAPYCPWLLSVPVDVPLLPPDLAARLAGKLQECEADILVIEAGGRRHHAIAVWSVGLAGELRQALEVEGVRRVEEFARRHKLEALRWPGRGEPFLNVNTPGDLARAAEVLSSERYRDTS